MSSLLDTCVISEVARKRPSRRVVDWLSEQSDLSIYLSVVTIGELYKGIANIAEGRRKRTLLQWVEEDLLTRFSGRILDVDLPVAERWGTLTGEASRRGQPIPVIDALLAATASVHALTLVTRNADHFNSTGVSLLDPWQA